MENLFSPYYVAVRDRSSGKIRLLPTQIFQLSPQIASKSQRSGDERETEETNSREKRAELTRAFGSSKAKRKLASAELARNDPEFLADSMKKALSGVKVEEVEETPTSLLLPPHHAEGQTSSSWRSCYGEYVSSWMSEERLAQLREHSRYHYKPFLKTLVCLHFLISFYLLPVKRHKSKSLLEEIDLSE